MQYAPDGILSGLSFIRNMIVLMSHIKKCATNASIEFHYGMLKGKKPELFNTSRQSGVDRGVLEIFPKFIDDEVNEKEESSYHLLINLLKTFNVFKLKNLFIIWFFYRYFI